MTRVGATLYGTVATLALVLGAERSFATEPGNFGQTLGGATVGAIIAAPAPAGLYIINETFIGIDAVGKGQKNGTTVTVPLELVTLAWSTGYKILGANLTMAVVQPFYAVSAYTSGAASPQNALWFENTANTLITPALLQWTLAPGLFASAGITIIPPDGSKYNGTTNPDYWTFQPRAAFAFINREWNVTANFRYDINEASAGHTGTYALSGHAPVPALGPFAKAGDGYTTGQQAWLDLAATYKIGKWEIGPAAALHWQTTADTPGQGFTCATLKAALPASLGCGKTENYALGGLVGYDFGRAKFQAWALDSVYAKDDYAGWGVFSRLTWKLDEDRTAARPLK